MDQAQEAEEAGADRRETEVQNLVKLVYRNAFEGGLRNQAESEIAGEETVSLAQAKPDCAVGKFLDLDSPEILLQDWIRKAGLLDGLECKDDIIGIDGMRLFFG